MEILNIAVVPGDGIGPEIVPESWRVLEAASKPFGFQLRSEIFPWGAGFYQAEGTFMPEDGLEILKNFDAVFFGSVGLPEVDDTLPARDFTFKVRTNLNQYVNFRPCRRYPGVPGPLRSEASFDFVVIRENTEGEFVQIGNQFMPDGPYGMGLDTSIFTRKGIERVAHYAFRLARTRRNKLTHITKSNTLIHSLAYWDRVIKEVAGDYPDVEHQQMYIDNTAANFVLRPQIFDVVLTTNLFGDILSDLAGALMGSLGMGGSGNLNPEKEFPSMFEPIHGSAPDIAGRNMANPLGQIWSGALMLDHLGKADAAKSILEAMDKTTNSGVVTSDLGGKATSIQVCNSVISNLERI